MGGDDEEMTKKTADNSDRFSKHVRLICVFNTLNHFFTKIFVATGIGFEWRKAIA